MPGPALSQLSAHRSIHDAALEEAEDLTSLLAQSIQQGDHEQIRQVAYVLLEHWETRTLRHADVEEREFYREIESTFPSLKTTVVQLSRDHELLRMIAGEIKHRLTQDVSWQDVLIRFQALILLNRMHSLSEETYLIKPVEAAKERKRREDVKGGDGSGDALD